MPALLRYILRQLAAATLFLSAVIAGLITLVFSLRLVDFVINRGLPLSVVVELAAFQLPFFLSVILPIALFIAVLFTYNRLVGENEIVVMRAAGVSRRAIASPPLVMGAAVMLAAYALNLWFVPATYSEYRDRQFLYRNSYSSVLLQEGKFNTPTNDVTVYVRSRQGGELKGIFIHDARKPEAPVTLMAERGLLGREESGVRVVLFKGSRQEINQDTGRLTVLYFDQNSIDLSFANRREGTRSKAVEEYYIGSLISPPPEITNLRHRRELVAEGHRRLSIPLYALAFAMLAVAALLSGDFRRRGLGRRIAAAVAIAFAVQVTGLMLVNLAAETPALAIFVYALPLSLFAASAFVYLGGGARTLGPAARSSAARSAATHPAAARP